MPSNFMRDEINAYKETLKAHYKGVFKMTKAKLEFYNKAIERYRNLKRRNEQYGKENNFNSEGYEI